MRRVNWNLANCQTTVQKLLIRQVLTKLMVWSWRFSGRQCVIDNVHSTMTPSSRLPLRRYYMKCKILKWVIWPWPRPFQGRFFLGRVGRAMVSQCTKYEFSRFTRYEAVNGGAKCRKWGGLRWLGGTQGQRQCRHSIERIRLPIRL